ncbi:serine/threonine-protein phosphatase [Catenovulum sp. SM1970]|uniref:PP2C family protein-serine/threonine phosphatase n=1 Tax=Marinifaba aquimaris TaxID=2741323 RepID=UPI001572BFB8|nr:protein phosphatase 2C domain-containing protein [Marinifaba aquimaris]NTS75634.1 serine/threonine-protein phosphatase [Marinifaba aquimaris]
MQKTWSSYSVTDVGKKRSVNQDSIYTNDEKQVWIVADGMGGHRDGDKASKAIVAAFEQVIWPEQLSERIKLIEQTMRQLNNELQVYSKESLDGQHIGSTIIALTVCQGMLATIWAGDSRCYRVNSERIQQISWDHSYIEEMLRQGHMKPEEAANSKFSNVITRAVGAHEDLYFDHALLPYDSGDFFVLCSDGLTAEVTDNEIYRLVSQWQCSQQAIDILLQKTFDRGARDNVSIIIVNGKRDKKVTAAEISTVSGYSKKLNHLAARLASQSISLDDYYCELTNILEQGVTEHQQMASSSTQELPCVSDVTRPLEFETANYPTLKPDMEIDPRFDWTYTLFIVSIVLVTLLLAYFFIF